MNPLTATEIKVYLSLVKRRNHAERTDKGTWLGMSDIRSGFHLSKREIRTILKRLNASNLIERSDCINGRFWRAHVVAAQ